MKHVMFDDREIFVMQNEHSYAAMMGVLSNIYMKAHASSLYREEPYKAVIIIDDAMTRPFKDQPESSWDRLEAIIRRMIDPAGGIDIVVYADSDPKTMFDESCTVGLKHVVSQCWQLYRHSDPTLLTINLPPSQLKSGKNNVRYFEMQDLELPRLARTRVDYDTPIDDVFVALDKSKLHICYQGGTAWLSIAMGIPTLIVHNVVKSVRSLHFKERIVGQELGNVNILTPNGKITHVRQHPCEHHVLLKDFDKKIRTFL